VGRPQVKTDDRRKTDARLVANYARLGATNREIADMLGVSHQTIGRRFGPILTKARATQKKHLRRMQWLAAKKGNVTMLIWLGKNILKQSDNPFDDEDDTEPQLDEKVG
jgi:predicted transcriptional regulator